MIESLADRHPSSPVPVLGLVGGIGSGKSAVARWASEHGRCLHLDADRIGHEVLQRSEVIQKLAKEFGDEILDKSGSVNRAALAQHVFGDEQTQVEHRRKLEAIVWPEIGRDIERRIANAQTSGLYHAILLDAAVLLEAGWKTRCDRVVFIDVPRSQQLKQVLENRGWSAKELARREHSQWPLSEKKRQADFILPNDQTLEAAGNRLLEIIAALTQNVP